jgi:predicted kinase
MNNEYIVVAGRTVVADSVQQGPAQRAAEAYARDNLDVEVVLYRREAVFKARVTVDNNYPKAADHE